jgi:coatomer protein complex subunit epsilon
MALQIQVLLKMDRPDAAEKVLRAMAAVNDDATLTQLATAWVGVQAGGGKVQEAFYVFQELGDKYSWTVKLFNGSAACRMLMGQFEDAEKDLLEALNKDGKDPETLANLAVCGLHCGRRGTQKLRTYLAQLRTVAPDHPLVAPSLEEAFAAAAATAVA